MVSAGYDTTCGIKLDNTLWCWGKDTYGQVGNGATTGNVISPTQVSGGGSWKYVATGDHTCGIKSDDTLWCWGDDGDGQVGNGSTTGSVVSPTAVSGGGTWAFVETGTWHTCGIKTDGTLWCWGSDADGAIGNGATTGDITSPAQISSSWLSDSGGSGSLGACTQAGTLEFDTGITKYKYCDGTDWWPLDTEAAAPVCTTTAFADSFEDGTISPFTAGTNGWGTTTSYASDGSYSAQSANIGDSQRSEMLLSRTLDCNATITFSIRVSTEADYDFLTFFIDGIETSSWSGTVGWTEVSYPVTAGSRTFEWEFNKDGSVSEGSDLVWVDNVRITEN